MLINLGHDEAHDRKQKDAMEKNRSDKTKTETHKRTNKQKRTKKTKKKLKMVIERVNAFKTWRSFVGWDERENKSTNT